MGESNVAIHILNNIEAKERINSIAIVYNNYLNYNKGIDFGLSRIKNLLKSKENLT